MYPNIEGQKSASFSDPFSICFLYPELMQNSVDFVLFFVAPPHAQIFLQLYGASNLWY